MFLTHDEIADLTERKRPSGQIRWLKQNGYPFDVGAQGHPKVLKSVVESRLGEEKSRKPQLRFAG